MNICLKTFAGMLELRIKENGEHSTKQMQQRYIRAGRNLMKHIEEDEASPFIDYIDKLSATIRWIYYGSVVYVIQFKTAKELVEFKRQHEDGHLRPILEKELMIPEGKYGRNNQFIAEIDENEYNRCKQELELLGE